MTTFTDFLHAITQEHIEEFLKLNGGETEILQLKQDLLTEIGNRSLAEFADLAKWKQEDRLHVEAIWSGLEVLFYLDRVVSEEVQWFRTHFLQKDINWRAELLHILYDDELGGSKGMVDRVVRYLKNHSKALYNFSITGIPAESHGLYFVVYLCMQIDVEETIE